jgi:hypothetical protein
LAFGFSDVCLRADEKLDYSQHIRPIFADRCFICHGPDETARQADLRLDVRETAVANGVIVPGKPEESLLIQRITAPDGKRMPPRKSKLALAKSEIETLRRWVAEGAEYRPHWAFVPLPESPSVPQISNLHWPNSAIDNFVLARLDREGLRPSPPASRATWLRRVTFDLTGLPPTPAEIDHFLGDTAPNAFEKVADRLLASPRFGERMTLEWLDVARYADSFGYQADGDMHVWPWRDWVIDAFNQNLPYDQFITWQLAGDLLDKPTRAQRLATAFCRLNRMTNEGGSIPEEFRNEYVSDRVHTVATAFMGLTLECARCHDHKYDPISMKDYYALGAFFNSIDEWGTYDHSDFRPTPTLRLPTKSQESDLHRLSKQAAEIEARIEQIKTQREATFREWLNRVDTEPKIPGLVGDYALDGMDGEKRLVNRADPKLHGSTSSANAFVPGKVGQGLKFSGDDPANFPHVLGALERWQPFTVAFWLRLPPHPRNAIICHRQSGTDTGFHGTELSLEDGRLALKLVRFWPGNAIAVRTTTELKSDNETWIHVAASYDGSSKASGLRIYLDGERAEVEIVRDHLFKNLDTATGHGGGGTGLAFGERFRSTGLKGGVIDELRIFDRELGPLEIRQLWDEKSLSEAFARKDPRDLQTYYVEVIDPEVQKLRSELVEARKRLFAAQTAIFEIMTMEETRPPRPAYVLVRGEYDAPKNQPVSRDTPALLPPFSGNRPRNRLGLARWLTNPRHPLTARVAVNRYWQVFFGRGLVATTENFGQQGSPPSHPQLLDWLARDFVASGWDTKALCRKIVLSSTYRQKSASPPGLRERDPENQLLARGPSRRLAAETLRDAALASGGLLREKLGGAPVKPYQPPGLWRGQNAFLPEYVADKGEGLYRRSLYTFWRRTSPPPSMLTFDAPTREVCVMRRQPTNSPLQPLVLLNDPQFVEAARALGERMLRQPGGLEQQVSFAIRMVTTHSPTDRETDLLCQLYRAQLALFREAPESASKFLKAGANPAPADLEALELAAASVTASAILNLDAAVMVR